MHMILMINHVQHEFQINSDFLQYVIESSLQFRNGPSSTSMHQQYQIVKIIRTLRT